jgi:CubicO group peptidase (beta-lactamase class C family)
MTDSTTPLATADLWQLQHPETHGMDSAILARAMAFAKSHETTASRDLAAGLASVRQEHEPPPWNEVLGPVRPRGNPNGLIMRHGCLVAEWGDTQRVDMTFSATKSYLGVLAGVALANGLIRSVDDPMRDYALDDGFASPHNTAITWRHMLQQSSEWEGTLWEKPDLVDRNRQVGVGADQSKKGTYRALQAPGTFYEYNDVRVNRLALSLLQVFRRPLPAVLKESIMDPIGASDTWEWHGYRNSWVEIDGTRMPSVSGGAHWGGGLWISSRDHALFGSLMLQRGCWQGQEILPASWIDALRTPSACNPVYGYLWWLNTERRLYSNAPASSFFALGAGQNVIWIDPDHDLVMVVRWLQANALNGLIGLVMQSVQS